MNFQQLRAVREAVRQDFNLTTVAEVIHASQPGISRQIRELETELGVEIFVRVGRRLTGLTPPGATLLPLVDRILTEADNLRLAGENFTSTGRGLLTIAATQTQARYALPHAVRDFCAMHPNVSLRMQQGSPHHVAELLLSGEAQVGIATEVLADYPELVALPCYTWTHSVIVPPGHALEQQASKGIPLTLERLAEHPIITYEPGYTGRSHIDDAFRQEGRTFNLVLSAMDADVIKTYVELGLGVGIIASLAFDDVRDGHLRAIEAGRLFAPNTTRLAVKRGTLLRDYVYDFIQTFAPPWHRPLVDRALATPHGRPFEA